MKSLPIDSVLPQLNPLFRESDPDSDQFTHTLVLQAETGAGKTTRVAPYLWKELDQDAIVMIEPRRLAAKAAAERIAQEQKLTLGEQVGYQVRFEKRCTDTTPIRIVTPGILLRLYLDDPFLESIKLVIFDEFHERNYQTDLLLALCRLLQQTVRPDLQLVVMSATLDGPKLAQTLNNSPFIYSEGRVFPVSVRYFANRQRERLENTVLRAAEAMLADSEWPGTGDILVFVPGVGEIQRCLREFESSPVFANWELLPLHGELDLKLQRQVLQPSQSSRIIVSTNIAETSLTVPDVVGVIDSGLCRQMRFNLQSGMNQLQTAAISKASAEQRRGRAGRTRPGLCYRLWSAIDQQQRPEHTEPEIQRIDLSSVVLQIFALGETNVPGLPWYESPNSDRVNRAIDLLEALGALDSGELTELGEQMARIPLDPRLSKLLLRGRERGLTEHAAMLAAMLSERSPFARSADNPGLRAQSDLLARLETLQQFETKKSGVDSIFGRIRGGSVKQLARLRKQLLRLIKAKPKHSSIQYANCDWESHARLLFDVFPDRLCQRRANDPERAVMVGGRGVKLATSTCVAEGSMFLAIEVDFGHKEAIVRQACAIDPSWLNPEKIVQTTELQLNQKQALQARRHRTFRLSPELSLTLDSQPCALPSGVELTSALVDFAKQNWSTVIPDEQSRFGQYLQRLELFREHCAEPEDLENWPAADEDSLKSMLEYVVPGCRSLESIKNGPWLDNFKAQIEYSLQQKIDLLIPETVKIPTGRDVTLDYSAPTGPVLKARIQELFGLLETPIIANGKVPLTIHLLAPNYRVQQITQDLGNFWRETYQQVRKDLRGRYPKHSWPEDPFTAIAESRPRRRRSAN